MILTALSDYYWRLREDPRSGIAAPGYSQEKIGYTIVLANDGQVVAVEDEHESIGKRSIPKIMMVPASFKRPGTGSSPFFLWDKTSYSLGVVGKSSEKNESKAIKDYEKRSNKAGLDHQAFKALHLRELQGDDDPGLAALTSFLLDWTPGNVMSEPAFSRFGEAMLDSNVVFRLSGDNRYLHERPAAIRVWERLQNASERGELGMCLVSGSVAPLARLHPPIKGFESTGSSIVSFNSDAYISYRGAVRKLRSKTKENNSGASAPISMGAAFSYTTALNHLLRRDARNHQSMVIGDTTVVFWAQSVRNQDSESAEDLVSAFMSAGSSKDRNLDDERETRRLHDAMEQVRQGRPLRELDPSLDDDARIFVLGLVPNSARLSIRFWEVQSLAGFARRLADHYRDLELEPREWKRPPSPQYLALQTAPIYGESVSSDDKKKVSPLLAGEITRAILAGTRYPRSLLGALIMRFRGDGQINALRVALCKAVLSRQARLDAEQGITTREGEPPVSLDVDNTDPGYLLGRLFSTLERVQHAALGTVNAGLRDKYYGAASATPASMFPVLLRNAQNHLGKLRKNKTGLAINLEKEIDGIIELLPPSFPRSLSIDAQGRFAIGYYHQKQFRASRVTGQGNIDSDFEGDAE